MELIRTPKVENVRMLDRFSSSPTSIGSLYLTATHLIFVDPDGKRETWILHMHVATIEKLAITPNGSPLQIRCKNFLYVTFVIPRERDAHDIYLSLCQLSQPMNVDDLYCFHYTASNEDFDRADGWTKFSSLVAEFERQGVTNADPKCNWVTTDINSAYQVCDTYPRVLYVPSIATTPMLMGSLRFRSKGRFPVLSYYHKNQATICRCSQPLSGFSARCLEDEQLLNCILRANPKSKVLYIVDTRPKINAVAQKAAGKGYENENFYENIKFHFFGIENIHVMRGSLQKLMDACELKVPSMNAFLSGLEGSGWLRHVKSIMETAAFIAKTVNDGISVVVHCSDGWDRTSQTCSIAGLLLDPYYRTIDGFQALIEKEWLSFGHKFSDRCGHIQGDGREQAPVMTQFIDAIWQLTQQFPTQFEFNERFLLTIHDHVYSCQFGTFIGNCEKDRVDLRLSDRTYSLWAYLSSHRSEFINPLYTKDDGSEILTLNSSPQTIKFWRGLYNRFEDGVHPRDSINDILVATKNHISSLQSHIKYLEEQIMEAKRSKYVVKSGSESSKDSNDVFGTDTPQSNGTLTSCRSIDSDDTNRPLRIVEECMARLEKCNANKCAASDEVDSVTLKKSPDEKNYNNMLSDVMAQLESVALDWHSLRDVKECSCSTPFDHYSRKFHCWSCGEIFCIRCIDKKVSLPGHDGKQLVPVCRHCYKNVMRTNSIDS